MVASLIRLEQDSQIEFTEKMNAAVDICLVLSPRVPKQRLYGRQVFLNCTSIVAKNVVFLPFRVIARCECG